VEVPLKNLTQIAILENLQEEQIACLLWEEEQIGEEQIEEEQIEVQ
jgi:hypothetical protein